MASLESPKSRQEDSKSRNALLSQIRRGTRLRQVVQTNDRSAPQIENTRRRANREGGSLGMGRNDVPQALGSLFADGFPVLRPVGQRDLTGNRSGPSQGVKTSPPAKSPGSLNSNGKTNGSPQMTPESPKPTDQLEISGAQQSARPTVPAVPLPSPLPPLPSGKPSLIFPPPPHFPPPPAESPDKPTSPNIPPPPPPQSDKPCKMPASPSHAIPPPLPLVPPCGLPGRTSQSPSPSSSQLDLRINSPPMPPPPPPPGPTTSTFSSSRPSSLSPLSPNNSQDALPPLPPKSLLVQSQLQKTTVQSLPLPPPPPGPQQAALTQKRRQGRGGGKLTTPPVPPARSPTTELSSKCQYAQISAATHELYPTLKNGTVHISDDFEAKFTFHSVEEFPPPDEFKPFQKIYPSQEAKDNPLLRTQVR
uniref:Uncharacterized protein n=1 Tax=Sphaerodactylus townsendi TaxID=933632 RepID=A0ACB8FVT1_9SAUR